MTNKIIFEIEVETFANDLAVGEIHATLIELFDAALALSPYQTIISSSRAETYDSIKPEPQPCSLCGTVGSNVYSEAGYSICTECYKEWPGNHTLVEWVTE